MIESVINLLKIKSIVTIVTTLVFAVLLLTGRAVPQEFMLVYATIIAFYFGTQTVKTNESKTSNLQSDTPDA